MVRKVTSRAEGHLSLLRAEHDMERYLDTNFSFERREGLRYCRLTSLPLQVIFPEFGSAEFWIAVLQSAEGPT